MECGIPVGREEYPEVDKFVWAIIPARLSSVVVITRASHARGPRFDPWLRQCNLLPFLAIMSTYLLTNHQTSIFLPS